MRFEKIVISALLIVTAEDCCAADRQHCVFDDLHGDADSTAMSYTVSNIDVLARKEQGSLNIQPTSTTTLKTEDIFNNHISSLKGISGVVPNLFIPDYGSRLTSAIYIRGIGSRINNPAVGLYVDNVAYGDKSAFDFRFQDIEKIEIMRGPQGTLYGRNTVGGLIKVFTRNPLFYQGTTATLGFSTKDNRRSVSVMHYHRPFKNFAFSGGGYYEGSDGLFTNSVTGKKVDAMQSGGGKLRAYWMARENLRFDANVSYDYSDEGAYPYYYTGAVSGDEQYSDYVGKISNNRENRYRRGLLNANINTSYYFGGSAEYVLNSVTSYQNLNDRMFLDQDFLNADLYSLEQKQHLNSLGEELTIRRVKNSGWEWTTGININKQWLNTTSPVNFYSDGINWLENTINGYLPSITVMGITMPMGIDLTDAQSCFGSKAKTPVLSYALFHQSTIHITDKFSVIAGARLDGAKLSLYYNGNAGLGYDFTMQSPMGINLNLTDQQARTNSYVEFDDDNVYVLPKLALRYEFNKNTNVYLSASEGMRSGGYNIQMFSEILQSCLKYEMMQGIQQGCKTEIENIAAAHPNMPAAIVELIETNLDKMPLGDNPYTQDIKSSVYYKPERSWNYELGVHHSNDKFMADASVFYIRTYDQQIAKFATTGLGRQIVNAGKSESYGAELSAAYTPVKSLCLSMNYGFTHAKFIDYDAGNDVSYDGNYVPFAPMHTFNLDASYTWFLNKYVKSISAGANCSGAGKIYWTESNSACQNFYALAGARVSVQLPFVTVQLWGRNLTNTKYNTFYFESSNRGYEQHGKPLQLGVDLRFDIK